MSSASRVCPPLIVRMYVKHLLEERRKHPTTEKTYSADLSIFAQWLLASGSPPAEHAGALKGAFQELDFRLLGADQKTIRDFLAQRKTERKAKTVAKNQSVLRGFYRWLLEEGAINSNPALGIKFDLDIKKRRSRILSTDEIRILFAALGNSFFDCRDRVLLLLVYETLATIDELLQVDLEDIDSGIPYKLTVGELTKHRQRELVLSPKVSPDFTVYWWKHRARIGLESEGGDDPAFFVNKDGERISDRSVRRRLKKYLGRAGLDPKITFQDIRVTGIAAKLRPSTGSPEDRMTVEQIAKTFAVPEPLVNWTDQQLQMTDVA